MTVDRDGAVTIAVIRDRLRDMDGVHLHSV